MEEDEILFEFTEGPYDVSTYRFREKDGEVILDVNDGELGRVKIENLRTAKELKQGLEKAEEYLKEQERRKEEL